MSAMVSPCFPYEPSLIVPGEELGEPAVRAFGNVPDGCFDAIEPRSHAFFSGSADVFSLPPPTCSISLMLSSFFSLSIVIPLSAL